MKNLIAIIAAILGFVLPLHAQVIGFGGNGAGWSLNLGGAGSAPTVTSNVLTITTMTNSEANSAFYATPQNIDGNFSTTFTWTGTNSGDGFTFVVQAEGATAVGTSGPGKGYNGVTSSIAIGLETFGAPTLQLGINGTLGSSVAIPTANGFNLNSPINFSISYNQASEQITLILTQTGATTFTTTYSLGYTVAALIGSNNAFVGFGGGTGGANETQTIANFIMNPTPDIIGFGGNGTGWSLNLGGAGSAPTVTSDVLTITTPTNSEANSAYDKTPQNINGNFSTTFTWTGSNSGDGFTFIVQGGGPSAVGTTGQGKGYTGVGSSIAIGLETFGAPTLDLGINGTLGSPVTIPTANGFNLHNPINFSISYNQTSEQIAVVLSQTGATTFSTTYTLTNTVAGLIGTSDAYVGFGGGTGGENETQTIANLIVTAAPDTNIIGYDYFAGFGGNGTGWNLNTGAGGPGPSVASNVLTITTVSQANCNSIFYKAKQDINGSFATTFTWNRPANSGDGDGFMFVAQTQGVSAVGTGGSGKGYTGIHYSFGVGLETYGGLVVDLGENGSFAGSTAVPTANGFNANNPINFSVVYNQATPAVTVTMSQTGATTFVTTFTLTNTVANIIGSDSAYVGFTGATGGATETQTISNLVVATGSTNTQLQMFGVNLASAEFGNLPGSYGTDYIYPNDTELAYYQSKGLTLIRLPFLWERIQPTLNGALNSAELARMDAFVASVHARGMQVILDMHDFDHYTISGTSYLVGSATVPNSAFQNVWSQLAAHYANETAIYGYDIMNEPHDTGNTWYTTAQAGVNGVRQSDTTHYVLVEGDGWSNASGWAGNNPNLNITDATGLVIYEAHCYFDFNQSGTYTESYATELAANPNLAMIGVTRTTPFVTWLQQHNALGMIGEYGVPTGVDARWNTVLNNFLSYISSSGLSGTYWAGGPWWGTYQLSCEPTNNNTTDAPQMSVLQQYHQ